MYCAIATAPEIAKVGLSGYVTLIMGTVYTGLPSALKVVGDAPMAFAVAGTSGKSIQVVSYGIFL